MLMSFRISTVCLLIALLIFDMDILSTNDFNFNELDMETMNSVMKSDMDFFSSSYNGETYGTDMIDEFLNLDQGKNNVGIYIEQQMVQNQVS